MMTDDPKLYIFDASIPAPDPIQEPPAKAKGSPVKLEAPEPWPDPVDGANLLDEIKNTLERYVVMQPGCSDAAALWCLFTHCFDAMTIAPRLFITSPQKQCGKTTLLSVIKKVVPKPQMASNITGAATFRLIELYQPTLLIDEADTFLDKKSEMTGIMNSGHNREGAEIIRCDGDKNIPTAFSTWTPMAIAAIGRVPNTLMDRSIIVQMRRKLGSEQVERFRHDRVDHLKVLCRKAARWAADNMRKLSELDPDIPESLSDRAADNWRPLLAIAQLAGGHWPDRAMTAMLSINQPDVDAEGGSLEIMLLSDIREILSSYIAPNVSTEFLISELTQSERFSDRPWRTFQNGAFPMTPRQLSARLKDFGIKSSTRNFGVGEPRKKGYVVADFEDAFQRYLPKA